MEQRKEADPPPVNVNQHLQCAGNVHLLHLCLMCSQYHLNINLIIKIVISSVAQLCTCNCEFKKNSC